MESSKSPLSSMTIQGVVLLLLAFILEKFKVEVDGAVKEEIASYISALLVAIGGIMGVWGRVRATKRIVGSGSDTTIPKLIILVFMLFGAVSAFGCSDTALARSADMFVNQTVGPEYIEYISSDPRLSATDREDRLQNVESFRAVVAEKLKP